MPVAGQWRPPGVRGRRRPPRAAAVWTPTALACLLAACAVPAPELARYTVNPAPGRSVILARVRIPEGLSGVSGPVEREAIRVTIQTEGAQAVQPIPLSPGGYLLAVLPPGRYRLTGWEARSGRATQFGPLDTPFEVPLPDRSYYLGTLSLEPRASDRYLLRVTDQFEQAMRYLAAEHPRLAGAYERHLLSVPIRQEPPAPPSD